MKDMPGFTTENGVAGLTLREIPYTGRAYIRIWSSCQCAALLAECVDFCRVVGAKHIYAAGDPALETYPLHATIVQMQCSRESIGETDAALWPVQADTAGQWKEIYNEKAASVPNAAWMSDADCKEMLRSGDGYFIHQGDTLLGIGRVEGDTVKWVASCMPGAGIDVVKALCHCIHTDTVKLEVAWENERAVRLYSALGFVPVTELSRWYCVL